MLIFLELYHYERELQQLCKKTEDEVLTCTDIVQFSQWKGVLEEKIAQAKISIGNIRSKGKGRLSSEELSRVNLLIENRAGNKRFLSLIMGRIREIFF